MLRLLFVDDEPESVQVAIEEVESQLGKKNCQIRLASFKDVEPTLLEYLPEIVVLDRFRGAAVPEGDDVGTKVYDFIWDNCFCPIVVYTARTEDVESLEEHPFVRVVKKGSGSERKVMSHIESFRPHVEALRGIRISIRELMNREIRDTAPLIFKAIDDGETRKKALTRATRRRISAMIDEPSGGKIICWEQYVCPPIGSQLLTGDVIWKMDGDANNPDDYCVVLTPSCDLVSDNVRRPKVENVLVAKCSHIAKVLPEVKLDPTTRVSKAKFKERVLPLLRRGYGTFTLPLPELPGFLPPMTVQLKDLGLIGLDKIGEGAGCEYRRVVSVDSPFREMMTWAYLQTVGRPGVPERDVESWASKIHSSLQQGEDEMR